MQLLLLLHCCCCSDYSSAASELCAATTATDLTAVPRLPAIHINHLLKEGSPVDVVWVTY